MIYGENQSFHNFFKRELDFTCCVDLNAAFLHTVVEDTTFLQLTGECKCDFVRWLNGVRGMGSNERGTGIIAPHRAPPRPIVILKKSTQTI